MVPSLMASKAKIIVISHSCKCFTVYKMLAYVFLTTFTMLLAPKGKGMASSCSKFCLQLPPPARGTEMLRKHEWKHA